jgi:transposase
MIRGGFLDAESRKDLIKLARDGSTEHRLGRRANALVLLDDGMSCAAVARVLLLDDDTVRTWHRLYLEDGIDGLAGFSGGGSACFLSLEQQEKLKVWITEVLPRTTRETGAWIEREFGIAYEGRSARLRFSQPSRFFIRRSAKSICLSIRPDIIMRKWFRNGSQSRGAVSGCTLSPHIARI